MAVFLIEYQRIGLVTLSPEPMPFFLLHSHNQLGALRFCVQVLIVPEKLHKNVR